MQPKAVVLDLDGTLLSSEKKISARNLSAIRSVQAKGISVIFATARPPRAALFPELESLGSYIFYNGAYFHCKASGEDIHLPISSGQAGAVIQYILSLDPVSNISIEVKDRWLSFKKLSYAEMTQVEEQPEILGMEELMSLDCTKILIADFSQPDKLVRQFGSGLNILVTDQGRLVQIMAKEASKERAVEYVARSLGISMDQVMCFGDDFNDFGLFRACGHSVAMGNAVEELKTMATEITGTNDHDGVALVLERLV